MSKILNKSISQQRNIQDLNINYKIKNKQEAQILIQILKKAKIQNFILTAEFKESYQLEQFQQELNLQIYGFDQVKKKINKKRYMLKSDRQVYSNQYTLQLGDYRYRSQIFMKVFKQQMKQLASQYKFYAYTSGRFIKIKSNQKQGLNQFLKSKIFELKNKLSIYYSQNARHIKSIKVSKKLMQQLKLQHIQCMMHMFRGKDLGMFYSTKLNTIEIIKKLNQITKYHLSIMNFNHQSLKKDQKMYSFQILCQSLQNLKTKLQNIYEIQIQYNKFLSCIVFHEKHQIFGQQIQNKVLQFLSNLRIFSIKCKDIRVFNNKLNKQRFRNNFLCQILTKNRRENYICIDIKKLQALREKKQQILLQFLKMLQLALDSQLQIKIFTNHIRQKNQIKKIQSLAEQFQFSIIKMGQDDEQYKVIKLKQKDYSQVVHKKRLKNLQEMFQQLFLQQLCKNQNSTSIISNYYQVYNQQLQNQQFNIPSQNISIEKIENDVKGILPWLKIENIYQKFKSIDDHISVKQLGQLPYSIYKRKRDLQKIIQNKTSISLKIFNINSLNNEIQWPRQFQQNLFVVQNGFKNRNFNQMYKLISINQLKPQQTALICLMNKQVKFNFIPVLEIQRLK